ncbi:MAG: hypothetical protein IPI01_20700 [Ignavibacteriae bacterium]|nr:hypothetical protein [Ignavibacteriota bacterium]
MIDLVADERAGEWCTGIRTGSEKENGMQVTMMVVIADLAALESAAPRVVGRCRDLMAVIGVFAAILGIAGIDVMLGGARDSIVWVGLRLSIPGTGI